MTNNDNHISFRANKENKELKPSLRKLARKANRKLNDYLNIILAKHVQDANETAEEE